MSWTCVYASTNWGSAVAGSSSASSNLAFFSLFSSGSTDASAAPDFLLHPFWQLSVSSSSKTIINYKINILNIT